MSLASPIIDSNVIQSLAQSPGGRWYPTRLWRKCTSFATEQVWRYLLEFDVVLPDEMFRALTL
jgi:hypothetical protein